MSATREPDPRPIPLVFCVDVEPDARLVDRRSPDSWSGFERTSALLDAQRPRIEKATDAPARFCWFFRLDPQITACYGSATWVFERYAALIDDLRRKGDHFGIHPHENRWLEKEGTWLHDFANQEWVDHCVASSVEAFSEGLGYACRSLRFGDRWLSTATVNLAERLGIRYDLTVEPGMPGGATPRRGEPATGALPDYFRVPRAPYFPHEADFRRAGRAPRALRLIPLTSSHLSGLPLRRRVSRLLRNGVRHRLQNTPLAFWAAWSAPNDFAQLLDRTLNTQADPYLAFAIRSSIGARPAQSATVASNFNALLAQPRANRFLFCAPDGALALWDANRRR